MKGFVLITLLIGSACLAQNPVITDTIFLDENWNETNIRSEASYYRGAWYNPEDSTWLVHDYYLDNFSIQMIGVYKRKIYPQNQLGEFRYFYKNGNLRAIYNYSDGYMNGPSTLFYENGNTEVKRTFQKGNLIDTLYFFYENGSAREISVINPNFDPENSAEAEKETYLLSYWDTDGRQQVLNGTGTRIDYYPNGLKRQSIEYSGGFPDGYWIQYGDNKKIISKMYFKQGRFISGQMYPKKKKDIFAKLYREPRYPGGIQALDEFVDKNSGKCESTDKSEITFLIRIDENGQPEFDQVISGDVNHCQYEELENLVRRMPKWTPAVRYGRYVESSYLIRVKLKS